MRHFVILAEGGLIEGFGSVPTEDDLSFLKKGEPRAEEVPFHVARQLVPGGKLDLRSGTVTPPEPAKADYRELRIMAYPPLADLADALFHQAQGDEEPLRAYFHKVAAVKAQHPKPRKGKT